MSHKQGQEHHSSYMDGVKVKISEQYKPPPKITLPMSYSQRISLNKQIQDSIPKYDFTLEKTVKAKMTEWQEARNEIATQRKVRIERLREMREKLKAAQKEKETRKSEGDVTNDYNLNNTKQAAAECYSYPISSGVLIPTQVTTNAANILTPIPLGDMKIEQYNFKPVDKSPFNISDFEADTSSPFDNMALKSINDMAELALVLQNEEKPTQTSLNQSYSFGGPLNSSATFTQAYNTNFNSQYTYPQVPSTSVEPTSSYTVSNGYFYNRVAPSYAPSFSYSNMTRDFSSAFNIGSSHNTHSEDSKFPRKVPDIMRALQEELNNIHLKHVDSSQSVLNHISSAHTLDKEKTKVEPKQENNKECLDGLSKKLQNLSTEISSMGFPLDRVVRVCKAVGDDKKKVVEHLLAMSELLDLGFAENKVSGALLECDNDRDKALDQLIL